MNCCQKELPTFSQQYLVFFLGCTMNKIPLLFGWLCFIPHQLFVLYWFIKLVTDCRLRVSPRNKFCLGHCCCHFSDITASNVHYRWLPISPAVKVSRGHIAVFTEMDFFVITKSASLRLQWQSAWRECSQVPSRCTKHFIVFLCSAVFAVCAFVHLFAQHCPSAVAVLPCDIHLVGDIFFLLSFG